LTPGTLYTFTVTPQHAAPFSATSAQTTATPLSSAIVMQDITTTRPNGALVLTQVCGVNGLIPAETVPTTGFPIPLPAVPAISAGGTAPKTDDGTGHATATGDSQFVNYPYPQDANGNAAGTYPTHCGINLGPAKFVTVGTGAGQFFATSGVLSQITVVDTRDTDIGWTVNGSMSQFSAAGGTKTFSGSELGWTPVKTSDSPQFPDSSGNTYDQTVTAGGLVAPNVANASGLGTGGTLASAPAVVPASAPNFTGGLGIAVLDARLKLLIPVTAKSGTYTATLTLSVI
jgi:hypothetical protein